MSSDKNISSQISSATFVLPFFKDKPGVCLSKTMQCYTEKTHSMRGSVWEYVHRGKNAARERVQPIIILLCSGRLGVVNVEVKQLKNMLTCLLVNSRITSDVHSWSINQYF